MKRSMMFGLQGYSLCCCHGENSSHLGHLTDHFFVVGQEKLIERDDA